MMVPENEIHTIPPGVVGEQRGVVSLAVDEIVWVGEVGASARIRCEWWGSKKEEQVIFAPVDVRNFSMCVPGGLMHHTYPVHTGMEKLGEYLRDASPLILRLVDGYGSAQVQVDIKGVDGYFPVIGPDDREIANVHVRLSYKDMTEVNDASEEIHLKKPARPLLRSRKQRLPDHAASRKTPKRISQSPTRSTHRIHTVSPTRKQKTSKVTFNTVPDTRSFSAASGTPIADSLIASLLDQSASLRASMREQLELTQIELDKKEMEDALNDKENNPNRENVQTSAMSPIPEASYRPTGWNLPVARLKQLAQLKSLTTTVISLTIQPFLLTRLKQPTRTRPSFVPASSGRRDQGCHARQLNISLFIKFSLPGRTENNFCSRKLVGENAEFGESALDQIKCDTKLLDTWWGNSIIFAVFCRQVGQKDSIQLGSASIGLKHLLTGEANLGDGSAISLPVYASQGLFRILQVPKEERKEVVGTVNVSFHLGSVGSKTRERSRPVSPQDPVRENSDNSRSQDILTVSNKNGNSHTNVSDPMLCSRQSSEVSRPLAVEKATLQSHPTSIPDIRKQVFSMLTVEPCPGMSSYSTLLLKWWEGREVKGKVLECVEQVLVPGVNGRMFNRKSISRMLESCLVVEVWLQEKLVGIARVSTDKLARGLKKWTGEVVEGLRGRVEVVDLTEGNIMGLMSVVLLAGTRNHLELLVGRERLSEMMNDAMIEDHVAVSNMDKETMTMEDKETMTAWDFKEMCSDHDGGKGIQEMLTDGYDSPDTDSVSEITEDIPDHTAVHSVPSLTENTTVIEPASVERDNFVVEILVEEGRIMADYSWLYCTLPSGLASKTSRSSLPLWNLSSQVPLSVDYLRDSQTQLILRIWSSKTECPDQEKDQMVGFAAIDLSPLLSFPVVSGWYNIINWMGKCRGQVKVTVKPLEAIPQVMEDGLQRSQDNLSTPNKSQHANYNFYRQRDNHCFEASGAYSSFPSHLVTHTEQIISKIPTEKEQNENVVKSKPQLWNPPTANFLPSDPTRSFLESSLAKNLSELDLLSTRLLGGESVQTQTSSSNDEVNDLTFIVEDQEASPDILTLSMVNSTINNQLASLRSLSCPETDIPRPDCQQLPFPPVHLELEVLNLEDSMEEQMNSDRSRVGPEGGNTEGY